MSHPRLFQAIPLKVGDFICLDAKASHHLVHVLRANREDLIILFNGNGGEFVAIIQSIEKKNKHVHVNVKILEFSSKKVESPLHIHLAQGMARGEKMDWIVQKAVELGVKEITPLITQYCNVRLSPERYVKRLAHWQSVIVSACEQSSRDDIPIIHAPIAFHEWINSTNNLTVDCRFLLSPQAKNTLKSLNYSKKSRILLLIGPEGGFSEDEVKAAQQLGYLSLALGPRILRTETASIAALSILQAQFGDLA